MAGPKILCPIIFNFSSATENAARSMLLKLRFLGSVCLYKLAGVIGLALMRLGMIKVLSLDTSSANHHCCPLPEMV